MVNFLGDLLHASRKAQQADVLRHKLEGVEAWMQASCSAPAPHLFPGCADTGNVVLFVFSFFSFSWGSAGLQSGRLLDVGISSTVQADAGRAGGWVEANN